LKPILIRSTAIRKGADWVPVKQSYPELPAVHIRVRFAKSYIGF